jgi:hypothetical protein
LRSRLWIFCAIAAVLTAIAFIPQILVLAAFLAGFPAIVLILAPYALLLGLAWLLADSISTRTFSKIAAFAFVLAGSVLALALAAKWVNRSLDRDVQELTKEDHDLREPLTGTRNLAIQFVTNERARSKRELAMVKEDASPGIVPPPARKQFCERLCLHLLLNGLADSVLVSSVSVREGDPAPPSLDEIGMRFHLERAACRNPVIKTDDTAAPPYRLFERSEEKDFAEEVSARMIAGECVVGEPARLGDEQIIVQENPLAMFPNDASNRPSARNVLQLNLPPAAAARLSIYRVQDGIAEEVFRQTQVETYPLLPVLLLGPIPTGEGGIGISEGFLRRHRFYSEYNLREVLRSKLGMEVVPITR